MHDESGITLLWIGRGTHELAAAKAATLQMPDVNVVEAVDVSAVIDWLSTQPREPELIVLTQSRPGEVSCEAVDRLRRAAPLSRLIGLLGSWCEGEARSGHPWPAVERVYWHQWPAWFVREMRQRANQTSGWMLPLTATPEERLLATEGNTLSPPDWQSSGQVVGVFSHRPVSARLLMDVCHHAGFDAVALDDAPRRIAGLALAIWDGDRCHDAEAAELRQVAASIRPAPVVALLTCPRLDEQQRALAAGAARVLSKPFLVAELLLILDDAASARIGS